MRRASRRDTGDPQTDRDLILACRRGDEGAWVRLLARYERLVYSIPLSYRLSADDAADITQLTFTILLDSLDRLADDSNLAAWLATVARRHTWRALERARRQAQGRADVELEDALAVLGHRAPDGIARWELVEWLHGGLAELPKRCRDLLVMLYLGPVESSYRDVSRRLRMPVGSIGPTRGRCLAALRRILSADDPADAAQHTYQRGPVGASEERLSNHPQAGRRGR